MNTDKVSQAKDCGGKTASRRGFLSVAAVGLVGVLIAPGVRLIEIAQAAGDSAPGPGASSKVRWGMLIDSSKCTSGCTACVTACNTENGLSGGTMPLPTRSGFARLKSRRVRSGKAQSLPMMCQHCAHRPCVDVCPTGASFKRADGIVLVDKHICIGCRYCMMACPYKARSFVHDPQTMQKPDVPRGMGTVESCTMCVHRVDRGEQPACVSSCSKAGHQRNCLW